MWGTRGERGSALYLITFLASAIASSRPFYPRLLPTGLYCSISLSLNLFQEVTLSPGLATWSSSVCPLPCIPAQSGCVITKRRGGEPRLEGRILGIQQLNQWILQDYVFVLVVVWKWGTLEALGELVLILERWRPLWDGTKIEAVARSSRL